MVHLNSILVRVSIEYCNTLLPEQVSGFIIYVDFCCPIFFPPAAAAGTEVHLLVGTHHHKKKIWSWFSFMVFLSITSGQSQVLFQLWFGNLNVGLNVFWFFLFNPWFCLIFLWTVWRYGNDAAGLKIPQNASRVFSRQGTGHCNVTSGYVFCFCFFG